jgi:hypothetical protein
MTSPTSQDAETTYRFSRRVRVSAGMVVFVASVAGTITLAVLGEWNGVFGTLIAVYGTGDLLAEQLGFRIRLARKIRNATLLWLVISVAILVVAAIQGVNPIVIAILAGIFLVWDLFSFRYQRRTMQGQPPHG